MESKLTLALILGLIHFSSASEDICRALVLSGGADKGAYESGIVYHLTRAVGVSEVGYDVISGVSAGAINTVGMSIWPKGSELEMSNFTNSLWMSIYTPDIWTMWPEGVVYGLTEAPGLVNTEPLRELMTEIFEQSNGIQRKVVFSSMDADRGIYHPYYEDVPEEDLVTVVLGSASFPGFFPYVPYEDKILVDGGTTWGINLISAVERCLEIVDDPSKIVMDMVLLKTAFLSEDFSSTSTSALDNLKRYREIKGYYKLQEDVWKFYVAQPEVQYRYFFMPSEELSSGLQSMLFNPDLAQHMFDIAEKDVQAILGLGQGEAFRQLDRWMRNEEGVQQQFQRFEQFLFRE